MLSKIFPQEEGCPILNYSGKYNVKLYFMGKAFKVEVDDKIPIDFFARKTLLPVEPEKKTIWSFILTKALLKFHHLYHREILQDPTFEDKMAFINSNVMYSLTGLNAIEIPFYGPDTANLDPDTFNQMLKNYLEDSNYFDNKFKIIALKTHKTEQRTQPGSFMRWPGKPDSKNPSETEMDKSKTREKRNASVKKMSMRSSIIRKDLVGSISKFVPFVAYNVTEFFENGDFNLGFARDFTEEEYIVHRKYEENLAIKTHFMNKEDIIKLKKARRELRLKLKEIERRKMELISRSNKSMKLAAIGTKLVPTPDINTTHSYTNKEIQIAKTCIKHDLTKPPNFIDINDLRWEEGSMVSNSKMQQSKEAENLQQTNIGKSISDFTSIPGIELQANRANNMWLETQFLSSYFDKLMIFYNPVHFSSKDSIVIKIANETSMQEFRKKEVLMFQKTSEDENEQELFVNIQFAAEHSENSFAIEEYDFQTFQQIAASYQSRGTNYSIRLRLKDTDQVFRLQLKTKSSAIVSFYSHNSFKLCSIPQYFTEHLNWKDIKIPISCGPLFKSYNYILQKILISSKHKQNLVMHLQANSLKHLQSFVRISLIRIEDLAHCDINEVIARSVPKNFIELDHDQSLLFEEGTYVIVFFSLPNMNIIEQNFECSLIFKDETIIDPLSLTCTGEIIESYKPNKYGHIFKEDLYFKEDQVHLSINLDLRTPTHELNTSTDPKKKAALREIDLETLRPMEKPAKIFIEVYQGQKLINVFYGINKCTVLNFTVDRQKTDPQLTLLARVVTNESPELLHLNETSKSLVWILKIWSNNTVGIVQNTQKEEFEASVIKGWEQKESGRAEKAHQARQRNLLMVKKMEGKQLTEKEQAMLNDESWKTSGGKGNAKQSAKAPAKPANPKDPKQILNTTNLDFLDNPDKIQLCK